MPLFPFSPEGVQDLLAELYALPDPDLAIEANAISSDFKLWIADKFILSAGQLSYLNAISNGVTDYYGQQCSFCFGNRLEIILNYPDKPDNPSYSKWNASTNTITVEADGTGQSKVFGELTFSLTYV
ncbi:hypothetical protein [Flavobacterium lindanitolerans]|uniref:hypothetical protein n=1 Tax=Flavobacterium lindanitolerans TaxID=428988 RepID=UPI0023F12697|nr:hypothetical protein [Flavobacterium lindanitolerans]